MPQWKAKRQLASEHNPVGCLKKRDPQEREKGIQRQFRTPRLEIGTGVSAAAKRGARFSFSLELRAPSTKEGKETREEKGEA